MAMLNAPVGKKVVVVNEVEGIGTDDDVIVNVVVIVFVNVLEAGTANDDVQAVLVPLVFVVSIVDLP